MEWTGFAAFSNIIKNNIIHPNHKEKRAKQLQKGWQPNSHDYRIIKGERVNYLPEKLLQVPKAVVLLHVAVNTTK